jgi:hypothetical protein
LRYVQSPNASAQAAIKAAYDKAPVIEVETNLDLAGASALAADLANVTTSFARTFTVLVEDVLCPEDFIGGAPRYALQFERHPMAGSGTYTVIGAKIDYLNNRTTLTVRG